MASKGPDCSICYEGYNDKDKCPRFLGCGHTFCSRCLERLLPGNTIDCPKCRNPVTVPSGVEGLLKNFALLDMVNKTAPKQHVLPNTREKRPLLAGNRSKGSHKCEACDKKHPANFCCLDCKENMCKTAAHSHTCNKASRDHQAVSLEELEANPQLASVSLICQKHNDKFRFFEEWCGNVVCRVEQFGHVCLPLAEAAFKYRREVEDLIEVTKIIEDRMMDAFSELTKDQEKGTAEIQRFFKKLHSSLSTREQHLTVMLDRLCKSEADFLEEQLERLCSWKAVLESVKQRAESTIQTSRSDEFHIFILNAKSELENAIKSKPERGQRQRERESEEDLRVSFNRRRFLNMLNRNCDEVLQQVFEDRSNL